MNDFQIPGYDLIGDIHGHADALTELLKGLDYEFVDGCYRHENRQVIFLGDFIDRGPQQVKVLEIVIPMVKSGSALAVMGNHEFNALAFHTIHPDKPGAWLRPRTDKNIKQHLAFLSEFVGRKESPTLNDVLAFFKSLPLWLDLDGLRVVHACWKPSCIDQLQPLLDSGNTVTTDFLVKASSDDTIEYKGIEALLKGIEYPLPKNHTFNDKDGTPRQDARIQWWIRQNCKLGNITLPENLLKGDANRQAHDHPVLESELLGYPVQDKPVFLGHYWMEGHPAKLAPNVACLDYSVAKKGKLVAYRWSGDSEILDDHFFYLK